ncbi:MAG: C40 family peptidase [Bacteroidota bacterium]
MSHFLRSALLVSGFAFSVASCSTLNLPKAHLGGGTPVPRSSSSASKTASVKKETRTAAPKPAAPVARSSSASKPASKPATTGTTAAAKKPTSSGTTAKSGSAKTATKRASLEERRLDIVDYAEQFKGIVYKNAGKTPYTGFDCSGFTSYVMKGFGVELSPSSNEQSQDGVEVDLEYVKPGDLIFFGTDDKVQHVAIVYKNDDEGIFCVHSTSSRGVIVENVTESSYWKPRIMFARDVLSPR